MDELIRSTQQRMEKKRADEEATERYHFDEAEKVQKQMVVERKMQAAEAIRKVSE